MSSTPPAPDLRARLDALAREKEHTERSAKELRRTCHLMSESAIALAQTTNPQQVLESLMECLVELVPADSVTVLLADGDDMVVRSARGFTDPESVLNVRLPLAETPHLRTVMRRGWPARIDDRRQELGWKTVPGDEEIQSWMGIPLISGGENLGCLSLNAHRTFAFTREHERLCGSLASQGAAALRNTMLYEQTQAARARAEADSAAKSRLLQRLSRTLRTPLDSIIGYADLLGEEAEAGGEGALADDLRRIRAAATQVHLLADQLSELLRLDESPTEPVLGHPTPVVHLLREAAARCAERARVKQTVIELPESTLTTRHDVVAVQSIINELMCNAVWFTRNGVVRVEVATQDDILRIRFADTGIGLSAEDRSVLFEPFAKGEHPLALASTGAGLGLSVARIRASRLGGKIAATGHRDRGATFDLLLSATDED